MAQTMTSVGVATPAAPASITVVSTTTAAADSAAGSDGSATFASLLQEGLAAQKLAAQPLAKDDGKLTDPSSGLVSPSDPAQQAAIDPSLLQSIMPLAQLVMPLQNSAKADTGATGQLQSAVSALAGLGEGGAQGVQGGKSVAGLDAVMASVKKVDDKAGFGAQADATSLTSELGKKKSLVTEAANFAVADMPAASATANTSANPIVGLPAAVSHQAGQVEAAQNAPQLPPLNVPVNANGWDNALGQRMIWMAGQQHQVAQLQLNPAHLGPMEIQLSIHNGEASAAFVSAHGPVRDAIENALPRLREMLAESGINLVNVNVSSQDAQRDQAGFAGWQSAGRQQADDTASVPHVVESTSSAERSMARWRNGAVDTFV